MSGKSGAAKKLSLEKVLDVNEANALHGKLMEMRGSDVTLDGSAVERAGTLAIQVLMSAARSWEQDKRAFGFSKISDALGTTMQLIGVNHDQLLAKESK